MTAASRRWLVRMLVAAEADYQNVLRWTGEQFGENQGRAYAAILADTLEELSKGPNIAGASARPELGGGLFTLHLGRRGQRARHFVIFRVKHEESAAIIEIVRILHDAMDLPRHLPPDDTK